MIKKILFYLSLLTTYPLPLTTFLLADPLPPTAVENGILFSFENPDANSISLAGEFSGWDMSKNLLSKDPATGIWSVTVILPEGRHEYKFVIDGEWMSGANLVLEVKRDKQGKLYVPEPKAGPNTPLSGKIRFGGNLVGTMHHRHFADENRYRLDKPRFHIDMDWDVTITKEANAFMRVEMDSFDTNSLTANLFKSHLDFTPQWFTLRLFNNEKTVQFDHPLRFTDKEVSTRYDTLEFFDEPNPNRAIGQKSQGLNFSASPMGWFDLQGFYLDKSNHDRLLNPVDRQTDNFVEDNWGIRAKQLFGEIFGFGLTHFNQTGLKWPYADSNNWFQDPATLNGRDLSYGLRNVNLADGKPAEGFKGWLNRNSSAVDLKFQALPNFWLFSEYGISSQYLTSVQRNNRTSGQDRTSDLSWKIYDQNTILAGAKAKWAENLTLQISYSRTATTLGSIMALNQSAEFSGKRESVGGTMLYTENDWSTGFSISRSQQDLLGASGGSGFAFHDLGVLPNEDQIRFQNFASSAPVSELVESEIHVQPFVKGKFGERFEGRVFGNFHFYKIQPSSIFLGQDTAKGESGFVRLAKPDLFTAQTFSLSYYELNADFILKIKGPIYLQNSTRYGYWAYKFVGVSAGSLSTYSAILYKPKKNIFVRLGWGVDPEGFDEDLREDSDLRERYLYDRYTEALSKGGSVASSLATAENSIAAEKRISLRLEIKY